MVGRHLLHLVTKAFECRTLFRKTTYTGQCWVFQGEREKSQPHNSKHTAFTWVQPATP
ncbi:hypothetical protein LEMLEM_LOCUS2794 [Lemmus lemmus]